MRPVDRRYLARLGVGRRHLGRAGLGADHLVGLHVVRLVVVGVHLVGLVVVRFVVVGVHLVGVVVVRFVVVRVVVVRVVVELGRLVDRALGLTVSEPAAPNDTAPTGRGVATRAQIVLLAIVIWVLAALLAVTVAGHQGWMDPTGWSAWFGFLVLAPAFAATEVFVVHLRIRADAHTFSLVELPLAFGLCFAPPLAMLAAQLLGAGLALVIHRKQGLLKLLFNSSVFMLSSVVAVAVFRGMSPNLGVLDSLSLMSLAGALMAEAMLSVLLVWIVISMSTGAWRPADLGSDLAFGGVTTIFTTSLAVIAVVVVDMRPGVAWMLAIPVVGTYLANWAYTTQRRRHEGLDFLYQSTQLLQGSPDLEPAVLQLLEHACDTFNAQSAELVYFGEDGEHTVSARVGRDGQRFEQGRDQADEVLMALVQARPSGLLDPADPLDGSYLELRGYRDGLVTTLAGERGVIGAMVIADRRSEVMEFDNTDVRLAETLALHTATALENGRLEQSLEQLRVLESRLTFQALHDPLTGLANRTLFRSTLDAAIADRGAAAGAVLFVDLDDFKTVNDSFGHAVGDALLVEVAERLVAAVRPDDTIARLGGDEFAIHLDGVSGAQAAALAERLLASLDAPIFVAHRRVVIRASVGIAPIEPGADPESVMRSADTAMYTAKAQGKHCIVGFEPAMYETSLHRFNLHSDLQRALAAGELVVHYQPIVSLDDQVLLGVEALVRWRHPRLGLLAPDSFLPLAEETGLIGAVDQATLDEACRWLAAVDSEHPGLVPFVNVNLSPRTAQEPRFVASVQAVLATHGLQPRRLGMEITENVLSQQADRAVETLHRLKALGIRLSLDDFGTGYSSLSHLQTLPVDVVKIAKPFVDDLESSAQQRAFTSAIVALGRALGLFVVAEGIERPEQLALLRNLGCDGGQGHYFARPMGGAAALGWALHWAVRHGRTGVAARGVEALAAAGVVRPTVAAR